MQSQRELYAVWVFILFNTTWAENTIIKYQSGVVKMEWVSGLNLLSSGVLCVWRRELQCSAGMKPGAFWSVRSRGRLWCGKQRKLLYIENLCGRQQYSSYKRYLVAVLVLWSLSTGAILASFLFPTTTWEVCSVIYGGYSFPISPRQGSRQNNQFFLHWPLR